MNDTQSLLGKLLEHDQPRDAIHIAVTPIVARVSLAPGARVGVDGRPENAVGIVDPFLTEPVLPGQRCWMFLFPNTITGLRHDWSHPSFGQEGRIAVPAGASKEEVRLREIAAAIGIGYEEMMYGADEWLDTQDGEWGGEYLVQQGSDHWRDAFPSYVGEFWRLYEVVRKRAVPTAHRESFFSCSC